MRAIMFAGLTLLAAGLASGASAHAHLLKATPAAGTTVASPPLISLSFSEKLAAKFSAFSVSDSLGHVVPVNAHPGPDAKTLAAAPKAPLRSGRYTVNWHAVSADTHRIKGSYTFAVK